MVVFTCSHCGDSVKKNQVDKHYQFSCRGKYPALTCVDCLKDFNGKEHVAHTSCVTEEERYSAKGFVSKPPSCKGKKKQESWIQFIRTTLDSNVHIGGPVKNVLELAAQDSGVPQKRPKFLNYCNSHFRNKYTLDVFESAWKFLEEKREEHKKICASQDSTLDESQNEVSDPSQEDRKRKRVDSHHGTIVGDENESDDSKIKSEDLVNLGKKKKKRKQEKLDAETPEFQYDEQNNLKTESKKEKKKVKNKIQNGHVQNSDVCDAESNIPSESEVREDVLQKKTVNGVMSDEGSKNDQANHLSKKEKKEKRKREKYEKQLLEIQSVPDPNGDCEDQKNSNSELIVKSKKNKKNQQEQDSVEEMKHLVTAKSKGKKKQKHQDLDNGIVKNEEIEEEKVEEQLEVKTSTKFNWEETVVKLLESKGELPLKRVEKKVVNEFINSGVHVESIEKVIAKFNKKIVKMSRVKVKKDMVKLVSQ